jgi:hypothetical protein
MKITAGLKTAALVCFTIASFCTVTNAEPNARKSRSKILLNEDEERYVMITGSHVPQRVKVKSIGTNTPYNLRIYTKEELESTGRQGVSGLALDPSIRIRGGAGF